MAAPENMTEEEALIDFLRWAYSNTNGSKYALILWGHGPQLLLQPPPADDSADPGAPSHASASLYLTPEELRIALDEGIPAGKSHLEIVAFDACSMSMLEVAYEIRSHARYMVASQEEVPDPSFPYDTLLDLFRYWGGNTEGLLREGVRDYVVAYQDYIVGATTEMPPVTLTAMNLYNVYPVQKALCLLACALLHARTEPGLPSLLLEARELSRSFVAGLYVDLLDFCSNLSKLLTVTQVPDKPQNAQTDGCKNANEWMRPISDACKAVVDALSNSCLIVQNTSADASCNGVSIYFPYRSDEEYVAINQPLVKGGPNTIGKGLDDVFNGAASNLLLCARRELIDETEGYYADLLMAHDTDWYRFIVEVWTPIVIEAAPRDLDVIYSAQQCAINAAKLLACLKACDRPGCTCKDEQSPRRA